MRMKNVGHRTCRDWENRRKTETNMGITSSPITSKDTHGSSLGVRKTQSCSNLTEKAGMPERQEAETERERIWDQSNSRPGAVLGPDQALPIMSGTTVVGSYGFADNTRACLPLPLGATIPPLPPTQPCFLYLS